MHPNPQEAAAAARCQPPLPCRCRLCQSCWGMLTAGCRCLQHQPAWWGRGQRPCLPPTGSRCHGSSRRQRLQRRAMLMQSPHPARGTAPQTPGKVCSGQHCDPTISNHSKGCKGTSQTSRTCTAPKKLPTLVRSRLSAQLYRVTPRCCRRHDTRHPRPQLLVQRVTGPSPAAPSHAAVGRRTPASSVGKAASVWSGPTFCSVPSAKPFRTWSMVVEGR